MYKYLLLFCIFKLEIATAQNPIQNAAQNAVVQGFEQPAAMKTFLKNSRLTYSEDAHADLLSNDELKAPVYSGCADPCVAAACNCSQWESSRYVFEHIRYPKDGNASGWVGEFRVEYNIEADGSVREVEVVNGESESLAKEMRRVLPMMPVWKPAVYLGEAIALRYYMQFTFAINELEQAAMQQKVIKLVWGNRTIEMGGNTNISVAEINTLQNETFDFYFAAERLAVQKGTISITMADKNKYQIDAAEALSSNQIAKWSAFLELYGKSGTIIRLDGLEAQNIETAETIKIANTVITIQ